MNNPFEELGRVLYEAMEHLDPNVENPSAEWQKMTIWRRGFYINCVERLFEERELVRSALELSDAAATNAEVASSLPDTPHKVTHDS